jgi:DNA-binding CsgD family transcriptional regulator
MTKTTLQANILKLYAEGKSYKEISVILKKSETNINNTMARIKRDNKVENLFQLGMKYNNRV